MSGLSLAPIHRDTQKDLKTEKGGVVMGHRKKTKIENQEKRNRIPDAKKGVCQVGPEYPGEGAVISDSRVHHSVRK